MALTGGWTTIGTGAGGNPIYKYDSSVAATESREALNTPEVQAAKAAAQDTRNKVVDLYNQVGETYTGLVNAGREEEAASLRDAAQRFARAGSRTGVSSDQRIAALQDLAGNLRVAGQKAESQIEAQGISQTLDVLKTLAGMDQNALNQSFKEAYSSTASASSSGSPLGFAGGGVRNATKTKSPLSTQRVNTAALKTAAMHKDAQSYFNQLKNQGFASSNRSAMSNLGQPAPFAGWGDSGSDVARQWGERVTGSGGGVIGSNIAPYPEVGGTNQAAGAGSAAPVSGSSPLRVAQAIGRETAGKLPSSGGFTLGQTVRNIPGQTASVANKLNPLAWLSAGYDKFANKLYGNKSKPYNINTSPLSFKTTGR